MQQVLYITYIVHGDLLTCKTNNRDIIESTEYLPE